MSTKTLDDRMTATGTKPKKGVHTSTGVESGDNGIHHTVNFSESSDKAVLESKKLYQSAKRVLDTAELAHDDAFKYAAKVIETKKGEIDTSKLEDEEIRNKFVKRMLQFYVKKARQSFSGNEEHGGHEESDEEEVDQLTADRYMQAYINRTGTQLRRQIVAQGANYDKDTHNRLMADVQQQMRQQFNESVTGNLERKDIEAIIRYSGVSGNMVKHTPELDEAKRLLLQKYEGTISDKYLKGQSWYGPSSHTETHGETGGGHHTSDIGKKEKHH